MAPDGHRLYLEAHGNIPFLRVGNHAEQAMEAKSVPRITPVQVDTEENEDEYEDEFCAPVKVKHCPGCSNANSAMTAKGSVIVLDSEEEGESESEQSNTSEPEQGDPNASDTDAEESSEESEEGGAEQCSRALTSAEDQEVVPQEQDWTVVGKTGHYSASTRNDNSIIRPCATGPQFFPSNWCESSSIDERSSCHEDLALPGTDDPDCNDAVSGKVQLSLPIADEAFEAMLQDFDQDAMEAEPVPLDLMPPDDGLLEHDEREGGDEEPLGEPLGDETTARRDLKEEATSLRHLLTHLPKNPHCVSCQQAKMRQRYSFKGAFKRDMAQFGEIVTCDHVVAPAMRMQGMGGEKYG